MPLKHLVSIAIAAAMLAALGAHPAQAQQNCEAYAGSAVSQNGENVRDKCGYGGPRWHASYGLHLAWCLTQAPPAVQAESRRRQQDLDKCAGGVIGKAKQGPQKKGSGQAGQAVGPVDAFCDRYASQAVSHDKRNRANGCGFSGKNWNGAMAAHYRFCMRVGQHKAGAVDGFTKTYGVKQLVWLERHQTMESAIVREKQMKKWNRTWKIRLIMQGNPEWRDLYSEIV